jgi:prepilin-type N-terminal cleavage/methylation domain-containing protein
MMGEPPERQPVRLHPPGGFTLVELLISVAIIALLISLLVPSLGRTRDQMRLSRCQSNLRNLGIALQVYGNDNGGFFPVDETLDNPHTRLIAALGDLPPEMYYCPSETRAERQFSDANVKAGDISYFYFSCEKATANAGVSTFLRWSVPWPRRLRNTMDAKTWVASDSWFSGELTAHAYYKKGVNYLLLDGSVQIVEESPRQSFK